MNSEMTKFKPGNLAPIDSELIDEVIKISDADVRWLKVAIGGFFDDREPFAEELRGIVVAIKPEWVMWELDGPTKIPFTTYEMQPEGFDLRIDLKIILPSGEYVGLSLAPSSARNFSRYMRRVRAAKLALSEVLTGFSVKAVMNSKKQKFALVEFNLIAKTQSPSPAAREATKRVEPPHPEENPALDDDPPLAEGPDDDIPF